MSGKSNTAVDYGAELDRHFAWFEARLSPRLAAFVGWLRKPSSRWVRIPLAILLVAGGFLSFLPILGLWMLPLGIRFVRAGHSHTAKANGAVARLDQAQGDRTSAREG